MKIKILAVFLAIISGGVFAKPVAYDKIFADFDACFLLYSVNKNKIVTQYNPKNRCAKQIAPNSTFKIPLSLMAFDQKIITESTVFIWDGKDTGMAAWKHNQNQTPQTWIQNSVLWVSQQITPKLGVTKIKDYLKKFNYGNQDFSGDVGKNNGLTNAWLSSSLKISALEQLKFLQRMDKGELPVSSDAVYHTELNMSQDRDKKLFDMWNTDGKTGSGERIVKVKNVEGKIRHGWFVGYLKHSGTTYIFVTNITDKVPVKLSDTKYGGPIAKAATIEIINQYFGSKS